MVTLEVRNGQLVIAGVRGIVVWGLGRVLFLDLGRGYIGVSFANALGCACMMYTFICVYHFSEERCFKNSKKHVHFLNYLPARAQFI